MASHELRTPVTVLATSLLADAPVQLATVDAPNAQVDAESLRRILRNLLDNAAKYGAAPYRVSVHATGDWVEVVVEDGGEGVPPDFVPQMFDQFTQAEDSRTRSVGGTGLGLSIVARLVTTLGGGVRHEHVNPHGARFVVRLPVAGQPRGRPPLRVLVIDDAPDVHALVDVILTTDGGTVVEHAHTPQQGIAAFERFAPDVTVMDYIMPDTNGIDVARRLHERAPGHPILLWTAFLDEEIAERALTAGIQTTLAKGDVDGLRQQMGLHHAATCHDGSGRVGLRAGPEH